MSGIAKAACAAALLNCANLAAHAADIQTPSGQWLKDGTCSVFNADAHPGDKVSWNGDCAADGTASGMGTAVFTAADGTTQSFTGQFANGAVSDGPVVTRWGAGWSYEGEAKGGVFNGAGILTTDAKDRFEGQWADGRMSGFGVLRRVNGERYAGDWKNDKPNGLGELRHADGTLVRGLFIDGKLSQEDPPKTAVTSDAAHAPFGAVSGKTLSGIDGSTIALTLIEGGMELQQMQGESGARKTTFTFMTDRMGTVVEDTGNPSAGSSVTGFFRLTGKGVEVRYADGRSAMLSAKDDGGVQMALDGDAGQSCKSWYPVGHAYSEAEKKAALNAYAGRLGLAVPARDTSGCSVAPVAATAPALPAPAAPAPAPTKAKAALREKTPAPHITKAAYHVGDYTKGLETVSVRASQVHAIDAPVDGANDIATPVINAPAIILPKAMETAAADKADASKCLSVDSDGKQWGFRNACGYAVQFAYCMADSGNALTACAKDMTVNVTGSVAANGFGALTADTSLKEMNTDHKFRWIACNGGAGEVVAHLDHGEPPAGRCERTRTASTKGDIMLKLTCATIALIAIANPAFAGCATPVEASALKTAVVQQELMVAALQCHETGAYNQFVLGYRAELQASDAALKAYFVKKGGEHGEAGYDTFKTKAANLSGLEQARDTRAFCADAHALFAAAAANNGSLAQFVESRTAPLDLGALCKEARPVLAQAEPVRPVAKPVVVAAVIAKPVAPKLVQVAEVRKADSDVIGGVPEHVRPANVWRREERAAPPPDNDDDMDDVGPRSAAAHEDDLPPPRPRAIPIRQSSEDDYSRSDDRYGPPQDWHERARQAWAEQQTPRDRWTPRGGW